MGDTSVPDWLTADFLKCCMETDSDKYSDLDITNYSVTPAVSAGNNFGSQMLRVNINYRANNKLSAEQSLNLIVKAPLTSGIMETYKDFSSIYEKEPKYYNEFIEETYKLCQHDIVPKHYPSPNPRCVVMEDLKSSKYEMVDRRKLLDFEHSKLYLEASAKLQALSIAVYKNNPEMIESVVKESPAMVKSWDDINRTMIRKGLMCMVAFLEDKPGYKSYLRILEKLIEDDKLFLIYDEKMKKNWPFKSFAQLDPWCTNMMFKYDSDRKVVSVKLLDFQTTRFTSPMLEFVTFFWCSVHPEVRKSEGHNLHRLYCDSLNKNLEELGCSERLPFEQLMSEVTELSPLAVTIVCSFLPFSLFEGVVDANELVSGEMSKENVKESLLFKAYQDPVFKSVFPDILNDVAKTGTFNYLERQLNI